MNKLRIALIGVRNFAKTHYDVIERMKGGHGLQLGAVMIRESTMPKVADVVEALNEREVKIYHDYDAMIEGARGDIDIISIPTDIGSHCELSVKAVRAGYHVICEKPMAGTPAECDEMRNAQKETGKTIAICFQNIYTPSIQRIKGIALGGSLGRLLSAKTRVLWPRTTSYYARSWAGKLVHNGRTINDCPLMNATAHYLNNMLYIAGPRHDEAAHVTSLYGENYRVKRIESCDTQFLRITTKGGVKIIFMTTHATRENIDPLAEYTFERGRIEWDKSGATRVIEFANGEDREVETFDNGDGEIMDMVYSDTIDAIRNGRAPKASVYNSYQQVICVQKSLDSAGIVDVPEEHIDEIRIDEKNGPTGDMNRVIRGIPAIMDRMYLEGLSFSEAGCPWAVSSKTIALN